MSLLNVAEARELLQTGLGDAGLQRVIDREEAWLVRNFGAHYVDVNTTVVETLTGGGASLFLRRPLTSVLSVVEGGTTLTTDDYRVWAGQGRLERLPAGSQWLSGAAKWLPDVTIVVTYVPFNDNDQRKEAIIDLARLAMERTAMKSESIAGEYSYTAWDGGWDAERAKVMRRLGFVGL